MGNLKTNKDQATQSPNVVRLAERLRRDIRRRSLREGDLYLTAAQAGEHFGVSPMMANRAMNLLAQRRWLVRHRSRGSFVGSAREQEMTPSTSTVYYLSFADVDPSWHAPVGAMVAGLRREIAQGQIQVHMVPSQDAVWHLRREVDRITADPSFGGIILAFSPREVQEHFASTDLPVVVHGTVFPGVRLPYICADQQEAGRLFVREAVDAGCRRMVLLTREKWRTGDTQLLDGILEVMQAAALGAAALRVRNVPMDPKQQDAVVDQWIRELLEESDEPTALFCRNSPIAETAVAQLQSHGVGVPKPFAVIYNAVPIYQRVGLPGCRYVVRRCSTEDEFSLIGRMLRQRQQDDAPWPESVVLPVTLGGS